uniref:Uncharacterized protein n=1 Tax=Sphaerodactylus townsendi TaxID=933632 RepID=A0ACB8EGY2_9SAUR
MPPPGQVRVPDRDSLKLQVQAMIGSHRVMIFSKSGCPYCSKVSGRVPGLGEGRGSRDKTSSTIASETTHEEGAEEAAARGIDLALFFVGGNGAPFLRQRRFPSFFGCCPFRNYV